VYRQITPHSIVLCGTITHIESRPPHCWGS